MQHTLADAAASPKHTLTVALDHAAHLLPAQGPIGVFIHHNTLHAFEHLEFHEAIAAAHRAFGAEGYLPEREYRASLAKGRMRVSDVEQAVRARPNARFGPIDGHTLDLAAILHGIDAETAPGLAWQRTDGRAFARFRDEVPTEARARMVAEMRAFVAARLASKAAVITSSEIAEALGTTASALANAFGRTISRATLETGLARDAEATTLRIYFALALGEPLVRTPPETRASGEDVTEARTHRDLLFDATHADVAALVNPAMVRMCASFLDDGVAHFPMPGRERGFYAAFLELVALRDAGRSGFMRTLSARVMDERARGFDAEASVLAALEELGVTEDRFEGYVSRVLLQLPGWAGMFHRLAHHPGDRVEGAPPVRLMDLLAVRLLYDRAAVADMARRRLRFTGPLSELESVLRVRAQSLTAASAFRPHEDGAYRLFMIAQLTALSPDALAAMDGATRERMLARLDAFTEIDRRRVLHAAFEAHHARQVLSGIAANVKRPLRARRVVDPRFQVMFCIDDREESFRRHFEEQSPRHETLSAAGFFGVAFGYRALDERRGADLCPVVIDPIHEVHEEADEDQLGLAHTRRARSDAWLKLVSLWSSSSRSLFRGVLLTPTLGLFAPFALLARVLFPRPVARMRKATVKRLLPSPRTHLHVHRPDDEEITGRRSIGFTRNEEAERVMGTLRNAGLVSNFAKIVCLLGHGASSVNNPHRSAYDCGACGGKQGGPNARLFAAMANDPMTRDAMRAKGFVIPDDTFFVGGMHDTTTDGIELFDTDVLPASHQGELAALRRALDDARHMSAHERCRRFAWAPRDPTPKEALAHVEARAEDLSEARPELGHATNAVTVVGRRELTRGLFLDRRSLLVSYDPTIDPDTAMLERLLLAAVPVCAGINLEYYFSRVDNERYGAGTKLPHNLVGLLGVMDGASSDLRTGLPKQMIEIHDPVRLLLVIERDPVSLRALFAKHHALESLVMKGWIRTVAIDPADARIYTLEDGAFVPYSDLELDLPRAKTSRAYYAGHLDGLPPALIALEHEDAPVTSHAPVETRTPTSGAHAHA